MIFHRYCSQCGGKMVKDQQISREFDMATGKPLVKIVLRCEHADEFSASSHDQETWQISISDLAILGFAFLVFLFLVVVSIFLYSWIHTYL